MKENENDTMTMTQRRLRNGDAIVNTTQYYKSEVFYSPKISVSLPSGRRPLKKAGDWKHRCNYFVCQLHLHISVILGNKCIHLSFKYLFINFPIVSSTHLWEKNVGSKIVGKISHHVHPETMIIIICWSRWREKIIPVLFVLS